MKSKKILKLLETNKVVLDVSFKDDNWRVAVPSKPGWYFFETNTPPQAFQKVGLPKGKAHYNLPKKVRESLSLQLYDGCILPKGRSLYVVYSGEARNLKSRAREHMAGHPKTACLALCNYPLLQKYIWRFHYVVCPAFEKPKASKLLRTFGEQVWRAVYAWPILCGK
ncbi:MAG: hypothetical protein JRI91_03040 [Deltaproteobacteria bacterium]|nr:hypothetical protein [Deltaproteobacteria bacterium]